MSSGAGTPAKGRFPASSRVRKRAEYLSIQERGARVSTPRFVLILSAREGAVEARLGVTASRKVGNAVVRARAKRLVREAFRSTRELWAPGVDVVVIVKRSTEDTKLDTVIAEWLAARSQIERKTKTLLARASQAT